MKTNTKHGGAYDRGSADAYYGRPKDPHYWPDGTYHGTRVEADKMTQDELDAYFAGYEDQIRSGDFKNYD